MRTFTGFIHQTCICPFVCCSLCRFIRVGGYRLLNSWLTYSKTTNNTPLLQLILLTLQKLPLKVDHLKQVLTSPQWRKTGSRRSEWNFRPLHVFSIYPEQYSKVGEAAEQECRYWRSVWFASVLSCFDTTVLYSTYLTSVFFLFSFQIWGNWRLCSWTVGWPQSAPRVSRAVATLLLVLGYYALSFNVCVAQFFLLGLHKKQWLFPDKKKKKEDSKVPVRNVKERTGDEEKKKEKPKAHAPSHTKIRSIGTRHSYTNTGFGFFFSIFEPN